MLPLLQAYLLNNKNPMFIIQILKIPIKDQMIPNKILVKKRENLTKLKIYSN